MSAEQAPSILDRVHPGDDAYGTLLITVGPLDTVELTVRARCAAVAAASALAAAGRGTVDGVLPRAELIERWILRDGAE